MPERPEPRDGGGRLGHAHPLHPDAVARARASLGNEDDSAREAAFLALLADPVRGRILHALHAVAELCVGDVAQAIGASEDAVGYGLRLLRTAGLVAPRRAGRVVYYRLSADFPNALPESTRRDLLALLAGRPGAGV